MASGSRFTQHSLFVFSVKMPSSARICLHLHLYRTLRLHAQARF
jgi:hypothetical protein